MTLLEDINKVSQKPTFPLVHFVDNQAMIEVVRTGRNPTMRHLSRVRGVAIGFLHEQYQTGLIRMEYITTSLMAADIYTKGFTDAAKWFTLCGLINVISDGEISSGKLHAVVSDDANAKDYKEDKMPPDMEGLSLIHI